MKFSRRPSHSATADCRVVTVNCGGGFCIHKVINNKAFSILELLAVIAIISIMAVLMTLANGSIDSMRVASSAQSVQTAIQLARSEAASRNYPVEVRFCRSNNTAPLQTIQLLSYCPDGRIEPLSRPIKLNESIVVETNSMRSSLFAQTNAANAAVGTSFTPNTLSAASIPPLGNYEFFSFFIRSDGTTSMPRVVANFPTITLRENKRLDQPPVNFSTIQVDPVTSNTITFRP